MAQIKFDKDRFEDGKQYATAACESGCRQLVEYMRQAIEPNSADDRIRSYYDGIQAGLALHKEALKW